MAEQMSIQGVRPTSSDVKVKRWQTLGFGLFIHFGVYSAFGGEYKGKPVKHGYSEQIKMWADIPDEEYLKQAQAMTLEHFNPQEIVQLAKQAGMRYIVLTSKHHDGFCLWKTETTSYNSVENMAGQRDIVGELAEECARQGIKFGLYYSLVDWHAGHDYDHDNNNRISSDLAHYIEAQLTELLTQYGEIVELWFDMGYPTLEQSQRLKQLVAHFQPNCAINGRIWHNQGDFRTLGDNQIPAQALEGPWQTPASIYHETWGYRSWQVREDLTGKVTQLIQNLIAVRARGGNYLLNIGPKGDGSLVPFEREVLEAIGEWLRNHAHSLFGTSGIQLPAPSWGELTAKDNRLYVHIFDADRHDVTISGIANSVREAVLIESGETVAVSDDHKELTFSLPEGVQNLGVRTIQVTLDNHLLVRPDHRTEATSMSGEQLKNYYRYVDSGNYTTLQRINTKKEIYLETDANDVSVTIQGQARTDKQYRLQVGTAYYDMMGSNLIGSTYGPFQVSDRLTPLILTSHMPYEDLDVKIDRIDLQFNCETV
ncbi:alpha-L-fucosidase [Dolosigranulum savutiense]|uniref:alpha-L-fucosidase n=1 Tax=Dolosigranulum savutiense TaxID=3110288 RepID=A0AB74TUY1_9LACT